VGTALAATGKDVYWAYGATLYRLARWPSGVVAQRACSNFSWRGACLSPTFVEGAMRSKPLIRIDNADFDAESFIVLRDRLIAPLINRQRDAPRALLVRNDFARVINLPDVGWTVCGGDPAPTNKSRIYVNGCRGGQPVGVWVSVDAGLSWKAS
jgi:hypothetical protein